MMSCPLLLSFVYYSAPGPRVASGGITLLFWVRDDKHYSAGAARFNLEGDGALQARSGPEVSYPPTATHGHANVQCLPSYINPDLEGDVTGLPRGKRLEVTNLLWTEIDPHWTEIDQIGLTLLSSLCPVSGLDAT